MLNKCNEIGIDNKLNYNENKTAKLQAHQEFLWSFCWIPFHRWLCNPLLVSVFRICKRSILQYSHYLPSPSSQLFPTFDTCVLHLAPKNDLPKILISFLRAPNVALMLPRVWRGLRCRRCRRTWGCWQSFPRHPSLVHFPWFPRCLEGSYLNEERFSTMSLLLIIVFPR